MSHVGLHDFVILKVSLNDYLFDAILESDCLPRAASIRFPAFLTAGSGWMKGQLQVLGCLHQVAVAKAGKSQERFHP